MKNPIIEEAAEVYLRRREYLVFHLVYIAAIAMFTVLVWPARGFMHFFRTETIPPVFQATVVLHVIVVTGVSLYAGLDRLAEAQIIRYSEWLERTSLPIAVLFRGKVLTGFAHTLFLVAAGLPFAVVAAGPAGVTIPAVLASELIVLLSGLVGRVSGMLISHVGESRYVVRVTGGWMFVALLFVATIQLYEPLNPIIAVIAQFDSASPVIAGAGRLTERPFLASAIPLLILLIVMAAFFRVSLVRHRRSSTTGVSHE